MKMDKSAKNIAKNIKENVYKSLDLPSEIAFNIPLITVTGRNKIIIENFKAILEYSTTTIRLNTSCGIFKIEGKNLCLKELTKNMIFVQGILTKFEYIL